MYLTATANVGARRLKTVVAKLLEDVKFDGHKRSGESKRWRDLELERDLERQRFRDGDLEREI